MPVGLRPGLPQLATRRRHILTTWIIDVRRSIYEINIAYVKAVALTIWLNNRYSYDIIQLVNTKRLRGVAATVQPALDHREGMNTRHALAVGSLTAASA
jgi:hypothetical protein